VARHQDPDQDALYALFKGHLLIAATFTPFILQLSDWGSQAL
jgi:hypothetical protein